MKFTALSIQGCYLIEIEALNDERGYFARTFCRDEFSAQGLNADLEQCSVSFNRAWRDVAGYALSETTA